MTRMDRFQRKVLQTEFERSPNWTQEKVEALASRLNITKAKVYKWNWDQRNKQRDALFAQRSLGDTSYKPLVVPDGIAPIVPKDEPTFTAAALAALPPTNVATAQIFASAAPLQNEAPEPQVPKTYLPLN